MSSQGDSGVGHNAVVCYFPDLPNYLRHQIGFDIIINPAEAGETHRVIHVELFFPDGFMCNPATFGGMPHPLAFDRGAPHFFSQAQHLARVFAHVSNGQLGELMSIDNTPYYLNPQCYRCGEFHREAGHCHNQPPQYFPRNILIQNPLNQPGHFHQHSAASGIEFQLDMSHAAPFEFQFSPSRPAVYPPMYPPSHFNPHIPMVIEEHEIREERRCTRVLQMVRNRQPEEFVLIEDTARFTIPQVNMRGEVLIQPMDINNNPQPGMPSQQRCRRPRQSCQNQSTSGITDTDHRGQLRNEDKSYLTQPTEGEIQMLPKSLQEIQRKYHTATSSANEPTDDTIAQLMNLLNVVAEENEDILPPLEDDDEENDDIVPPLEDDDEENEDILPPLEDDDEENEDILPPLEDDDEKNEDILPPLEDDDEKNEENVLKDNKEPGDDPNANNDN